MSLTRQLAKLEKWYPGKHPLTPKPSVVIKQLDYNYYKQVNSAISRMYLNYKELSRKNGCDFSYLFLSKIQQHRERLSDENTAHAMKLHKELKAYGDIVGTLAEADALDGHVFEEWCAELLKNNGFINVEVTKGSGDQGVDVLAVKDGVRYAVQCKRYSSNLDNTPIQEVFAGKQMYDCHVGAVMTNQYFTSGAKELANKTGVLLWDRDEIQKMLEVQAAGRKAL